MVMLLYKQWLSLTILRQQNQHHLEYKTMRLFYDSGSNWFRVGIFFLFSVIFVNSPLEFL